MAKRARKSYTEAQRTEILAVADRDKLTAAQVKKRFGVTPVTYYSWRKKRGLAGRRGPHARVGRAVATGGSDFSSQVRAGVQAKVREVLPSIVREEVGAYLNQLFGAPAPRRRGRPPGARNKK